MSSLRKRQLETSKFYFFFTKFEHIKIDILYLWPFNDTVLALKSSVKQ